MPANKSVSGPVENSDLLTYSGVVGCQVGALGKAIDPDGRGRPARLSALSACAEYSQCDECTVLRTVCSQYCGLKATKESKTRGGVHMPGWITVGISEGRPSSIDAIEHGYDVSEGTGQAEMQLVVAFCLAVDQPSQAVRRHNRQLNHQPVRYWSRRMTHGRYDQMGVWLP